MRFCVSISLLVVCSLALSGVAFGQTMIQYGAATATGVTAGTAAGKKASDALTGLMGQAAGTGQSDKEKAAQEKAAQEKAAKEAAKAAKDAKVEPGRDKQADGNRSGAANMPGSPGPNQGPSGNSGLGGAAQAKGGNTAKAAKPAASESLSQARESAFQGKAEPDNAARANPAAAKTVTGKAATANPAAVKGPVEKVTTDKATMVASTRPAVNLLTGAPVSKKSKAAPVTANATQQMVQTVEPEPDPVAEIPMTMKLQMEAFHPALQPMAERMQRVKKGATRDDVKRILGAPASKVTIPGDNDVNEIYYFQERGRNIGTVRLEAGVVTRVNADGI